MMHMKPAANKGLELILEVSEEVPPTFLGDESRLRQVLLNLLSNAVKFTDQGRIQIMLVRQPQLDQLSPTEEVLFTVRDSGCGIAPEQMDRLFKNFSQVDSSTSRRSVGTGLGLAICKGIIQRMGGRIWAQSVAGQGSTFSFALPLAMDRRRQLRCNRGKTMPDGCLRSNPCRILLAEDDIAVQKIIQALLRRRCWEVEAVGDGAAAVAAWRRGGFDLILMDIQMMEMDGLTATRQIRCQEATSAHIPIVALTAQARRENLEACIAAGMDDVLVKPVRFGRLQAVIEGLLADTNQPHRTTVCCRSNLFPVGEDRPA